MLDRLAKVHGQAVILINDHKIVDFRAEMSFQRPSFKINQIHAVVNILLRKYSIFLQDWSRDCQSK